MAELTNADGIRIRFDSSRVTAVANHDDAGNGGTVVYGIMKTAQNIAESCEQFLCGLQISDNFVPFSRPTGTTIWINATSVDYIRERLPTDVPAVRSVISFGGAIQGVAQDLQTATAALNVVHNKF